MTQETEAARILRIARQRITELCEAVNTLHRIQGGNGRKVRVEDYLAGLELDQ